MKLGASFAARLGLRRTAVIVISAGLLLGIMPPAPAAMSEPFLLAPSDTEVVNDNPVLSWDSVAGAARYKVQVSTSSGFTAGTTPVNEETYNTTTTPATELPLGTLHWRVAAVAPNGTTGPWSTSSFQKTATDAPVLNGPADAATLTFPTDPAIFSWEPVAGVKEYKLEIDDAADFIGATSKTTSNTSYVLTEPQTVGQTFYWRVQGVLSTNGVNTEWSPTRSYSIAWPGQPVLTYPPDGVATSIEDVVLEWNPVLGASTYQLQVSSNGDWANNVTLDQVVKSTRFSPPKTLSNDEYYWRVRARDAKDTPNLGPWSVERSFERAWTDKPQLLYPNDTVFDLRDLEFSWTPVDHASYYEIMMSTDSNFSPGTTRSCYTNHTTWSTYDLASGTAPVPGGCAFNESNPAWPPTATQIYWRVRGIDVHASVLPTAGVFGLWSTPRSFMYQIPAPVMTGPASGTITETPILEWEPVDGAVRYKVTIMDKNGSKPVDGVSTVSTSYTPINALTEANAPFTWYVQAVDSRDRGGLIPNQFQWRSFTPLRPTCVNTTCEPTDWTTYATPEPLTPATGHSTYQTPKMSWQPVTNADHYRVYYNVQGSPVEWDLAGAKLHYPAYTHTAGNIPRGTYEWHVVAFNKAGGAISMGSSRTFTVPQLELVTPTAPADCDTPDCDWIGDTPTMRWDPVEGATRYRVSLSNDPNFTNIVREYITEKTALTPRESLLDSQAGQAYYWFVRPCFRPSAADPEACGRFNNDVFNTAWAFKKRSVPIELVTPAAAASVANQTTFTWTDFLETNQALDNPVTQEAKTYKIQISTTADFSQIVHEKEVDQTTYTPYESTLPEGPLYWRVFAIDASNNPLTVSETRLVTKESPTPTLTLPADNATVDGTPYLRWDAQNYASKYEVEIYKAGDLKFTPANKMGTGFSGVTKMSAWSPSAALPAGTYAWRVRRQDASDRPGPWSVGRLFTLQPDAPQLVSPENDVLAKNNDVVFEWNGVQGATKYRFELAKDAAFSQMAETKDTVMTSWAPTKLISDGQYYWRVSALDGGNNAGPASTERSWRKDITAPETTLVAPVPTGVMTSTTAKFTFSSADIGATFSCSIDGKAFQACASPKTYKSLAQGNHTFKVRATDAAANTDSTPATAAWTVSTLNLSKIVYKAKSLTGEYVQISNTSGSPVKMNGFKLMTNKKLTYKFPAYTIPGKGKVKVHTGKGADTKTDLYWDRTKQAWDNTSGAATLKRPDGSAADSCVYNNPYANYITC